MTKPLDDQELAAIRARLRECVDGPWIHRGDGLIETSDHRVVGVTCSGNSDSNGKTQMPRTAHGQFLAAAREDIPRLLAEVDRLRELVNKIRLQVQTEPMRSDAVPSPKGTGSSRWRVKSS